MILIKPVEMIEISIAFAKNVLNLFVLFLLFDLRIVEKEKCGKRFEICLLATICESRERKKRKEKCDFSHLSNWMKLPRDWIG